MASSWLCNLFSSYLHFVYRRKWNIGKVLCRTNERQSWQSKNNNQTNGSSANSPPWINSFFNWCLFLSTVDLVWKKSIINALSIYRGYVSGYHSRKTHKSSLVMVGYGWRSWVQIWPKFYHCNCCAVCTIAPCITAIYRESMVYFRYWHNMLDIMHFSACEIKLPR